MGKLFYELNTRLYCAAEKGIVKKKFIQSLQIFAFISMRKFFPMEREKNAVSDIITAVVTHAIQRLEFTIFGFFSRQVKRNSAEQRAAMGSARGKYLRQAPCCLNLQYHTKVKRIGKNINPRIPLLKPKSSISHKTNLTYFLEPFGRNS